MAPIHRSCMLPYLREAPALLLAWPACCKSPGELTAQGGLLFSAPNGPTSGKGCSPFFPGGEGRKGTFSSLQDLWLEKHQLHHWECGCCFSFHTPPLPSPALGLRSQPHVKSDLAKQSGSLPPETSHVFSLPPPKRHPLLPVRAEEAAAAAAEQPVPGLSWPPDTAFPKPWPVSQAKAMGEKLEKAGRCQTAGRKLCQQHGREGETAAFQKVSGGEQPEEACRLLAPQS